MNMKDLKRDAAAVHACMKEVDDKVVAMKPIKIYIPTRFRDKGLAIFSSEIFILGCHLLVTEDNKFGINNIPGMMRVEPDDIVEVMLDGVPHIELSFLAGSNIYASVMIVKNDKLLYHLYNEMLSRGNVPVYLDYLDRGRLFDYAKYFGGATLSNSISILHLLISLVSRDAKDLNVYFRQTTDGKDMLNLATVPIRSVTHGASNAVGRIMGGHFSDKITAALVNPSTEEENIEHILRS